MLKAVAKEISVPLCILFNRSFREGIFATSLKESNVLPLFKKGDKSLPANYRPISLLCNIGKLQERIVFKNIYNHLHEHHLLYKYQSGFLPNHSTTFQLIDIYHHVCQTFDNEQFSCMVFCDVSKAFDRVWHRGLLFKLRQYGISGLLLEWISDYLTNRTQRVVIRSCTSTAKNVNAGVPQGSVLGPLLFLIYVNDIADPLLSLTRLFADDSSLYCSASKVSDLEGIINHDLLCLSAWARQWLVNFNPSKTEAILFTLKKTYNLPQIVFNGIPVTFVTDHKHLGLTLNNTGKWHTHIENIVASASKIIGIMRKLKFSFHRSALNQIYMAYVLPILEYSSVVWDNCTVLESNTLEKLQNEAARIVTGLTRSVSLENLYHECGWVPLRLRRQEQKLSFIYKAINGQTPDYISEITPSFVRETTNYPLRNQNNLAVPFTRTEISRKSCIPSSASLWNSLEEDVRSASSLSQFKSRLKHLRPNSNDKVPSFYLTGDRYNSVMHARIRNKCSNLKNDLFNNHLCPTPICNCNQGAEDAEHFFFKCPLYQEKRIVLFHATRQFHPLNANKLIYGNPNLSDNDNMCIFTAVQNYIKTTRRFTAD
ncbi:MAG: reverse transcriptase family protein [Candidatus Thiodiazotropha endolucinida]|nr:reverse transcriptase family protein [Candidatus Thiodiazotropha taylori]MCW4249839.1 reverse transcriptase family protein [Candidatus Thiodiazotropha endolucinida]